MGKPKPPPAETPSAPFNNPFAGLAGRLPAAPVAPPQQQHPPPPSGPPARGEPQPRPAAGPPRAVVRLERKGRGGKEATIVEKLDLGERELTAWLGELKRGLGCGGQLEGGALVLHGDLRPRVKAWLEARGVRKVTLG